MIDSTRPGAPSGKQSLMDELLRAGMPEIKLALGEVIDRENVRPLPSRYARLLPQTLLVVTLRPDAAEALAPIVADVERELTDSCNRHGSLYDRSYRVQLRRSEDPEASLYSVGVHAGSDVVPLVDPEPELEPEPRRSPVAASSRTVVAEPAPSLPLSDPDATRLGHPEPTGWQPGRWILVVEGAGGEEREVFRLGEPTVTIGRRTDDPGLRASIAISDAPHVSRRQLALSWEERDGAPGFRVYNLGLNLVHLPGRDIPGSKQGKEAVDLDAIAERHTGWLPPGVPLRIGEHGPVLRIEDLPASSEDVWIDPDATVFD